MTDLNVFCCSVRRERAERMKRRGLVLRGTEFYIRELMREKCDHIGVKRNRNAIIQGNLQGNNLITAVEVYSGVASLENYFFTITAIHFVQVSP